MVIPQIDLEWGDYCHGYRWSDKDVDDPWAVGFLNCIMITKDGLRYNLVDEDQKTFGWFSHCEKITVEEGVRLLFRRGSC